MTVIGRLVYLTLKNCLRQRGLAAALVLALLNIGCQSGVNVNYAAGQPPVTASTAARPGYEVVNVFPHDPSAYTQGLIFSNGALLESTGREGSSTLRRVELQTGKVLEQVSIPRPYFAEGLALLNGKLYQLTWQHGVGFIYNAATLDKVGEFKYSGEGWGLTTDGSSLILSDGSSSIRFLDPETFKLRKSIAVLDRGKPVNNINELEFVHGEIYANIWYDERVARIDPQTGRVNSWIDLTGLKELSGASDEEGVLNGIAFDETTGRLFVTGKLWPKLFEIRLKQK